MLNIVLDLDQTLIDAFEYHISEQFANRNNEPYNVAINDPNFMLKMDALSTSYFVFARPHLYDFLNKIGEHYNLYIFTMGTLSYAKPIVNHIQLRINYKINKIWTKDEYNNKAIRYTKLNPSTTFIFDDNPQIWIDGHTNLIRAEPYFSNFRRIYRFPITSPVSVELGDYLPKISDLLLKNAKKLSYIDLSSIRNSDSKSNSKSNNNLDDDYDLECPDEGDTVIIHRTNKTKTDVISSGGYYNKYDHSYDEFPLALDWEFL